MTPTSTIPLVWPRPGTRARDLTTALRQTLDEAINVPMLHSWPTTDYVRWCLDTVSALSPWLPSEDVDRLIRTPTYWASLNMHSSNSGDREFLGRVVNEEMLARRRELQEVIDSVEQFERQFADPLPTAVVVPDTNVLLEYPQPLAEANWHEVLDGQVPPMHDVRVVIPLLVVDELDDLKRIKRTEARAKATLKTLYERFGPNVAGERLLRQRDSLAGQVVLQVLMESPTHARAPRADDELIRVSAQLSAFTSEPVMFVTYDTGASLRASAAGLRHVRLRHRLDP